MLNNTNSSSFYNETYGYGLIIIQICSNELYGLTKNLQDSLPMRFDLISAQNTYKLVVYKSQQIKTWIMIQSISSNQFNAWHVIFIKLSQIPVKTGMRVKPSTAANLAQISLLIHVRNQTVIK